MRLRRTLFTLALAAAVFGAAASAQTPADRVDPFIGTTNFGTANPGAVTPHGMMSVVPFNVMGSEENVYDKDARWWSTPYEYHNKFFTGFAHGALPKPRPRRVARPRGTPFRKAQGIFC